MFLEYTASACFLRPCQTAIPCCGEEVERINQDDEEFAQTKLYLSAVLQVQHIALDRLKTFTSTWTTLQSDEPLLHLLYYATADFQHVSPYSAHDISLFQKSHRADQATKRCLRLSGLATTLTFLGFAVYTYPTSLTLSACNLIASFTAQCVALIATGTNPDFKSDAANEKQDRMNALKNTFQLMAGKLIRLSLSHPNLAADIAYAILSQWPTLLSAMRRDGHHDDSCFLADLTDLSAACNLTVGDPMPPTTSLAFRNHYALLTGILPDNMV